MFFGDIDYSNIKGIISNLSSLDIVSVNIEQINGVHKETIAYTVTCKNNKGFQEMFFVDYFGTIYCIINTKDDFKSFKLTLNKNEFKDYDFISNMDSIIDNFTYRITNYINYYNAPYENLVSLLFEMTCSDLEFTHDLTFTNSKHKTCTMEVTLSDNESIRAYGTCIA